MIEFNTPAMQRYRAWRYAKDKIARVSIGLGGTAVLAAILTIFLYLLYEIIPLFESAKIEQSADYPLVAEMTASEPWYLATEEQAEVALRVDRSGGMQFFRLADGSMIDSYALPEAYTPTSLGVPSDESHLLAFGLESGQALVVKHNYKVSYPDNKRLITPGLEYPLGDEPVELDEQGRAITQIAFRDGEENMTFAGALADGALKVWRFTKEVDFLTEEVVLERNDAAVDLEGERVSQLLLDVSQQWLFVLTEQQKLHVFDIAAADTGSVSKVDEIDFSAQPVTEIKMLLGGISVLVGHQNGEIAQWFMARDEERNWYLAEVREFDAGGHVGSIALEQRRKGFLALTNEGVLNIFHSTSHRQLLSEKVVEQEIAAIALSPRAQKLLIETKDQHMITVYIHNKHPETSMHSLWDKVWYESYDQAEYTWQSSAATSDFEPKYSLMPLSFGTLKAAFYAMLLGAPLAICGAIYTAYFMAPAMRKKIKPLVELMEALPTVILGFLAGLWLAPFMERNLAAIFTLLIFMPIGILLAAYLYVKLPAKIRHSVPEGWEAGLLIPVVIFIVWACIAGNGIIEYMFFDGDMRSWVTHDLGISFDQRNALVVGIAMGFAVIPTIFSIAEDAIFSVPKHLSFGSLALGATRWQTLVGVVMPTASPGIFSALMIGLGRAVGETMIVLMATGNTPVMDLNIFEGMRTLAANLAVEMPETEVDSTHYRVLFLAALVLFMFTFVVNTAAEIVRQRLRKKYGQI